MSKASKFNTNIKRLSPEPLLAAFERRGGIEAVLELREIDHAERRRASRALHHARRHGFIGVFQVDTLCINVLGVHPAQVYGEAWFTAPDNEVLQMRLAKLARRATEHRKAAKAARAAKATGTTEAVAA